MKSCKNCKKFNNITDKCYKFEVGIIDKTNAQYCKFYEEKRDIKEKIKCCWCEKVNKYNWCYHKKRCLTDIELKKQRTCLSFKYKKGKVRNKSYELYQ